MITTILRPNLIKRYNNLYIRRKCDLNCKERCVNLMSKQTDSLDRISNNTQTILIISMVNLMAPIILIGATSVASLITRLLH